MNDDTPEDSCFHLFLTVDDCSSAYRIHCNRLQFHRGKVCGGARGGEGHCDQESGAFLSV